MGQPLQKPPADVTLPGHRSAEEKLRAVRAAARHEFPTGDIDQMLSEIEQGYRFDPPA
jgi:hypothetical protein